MLRALFILALLTFAMPAQADTAKGQPLFNLAVDYSKLQRQVSCRRDAAGALYKRCYDARQSYDAALARAKAENKPLMIIWGFDECSACRFMESREFNPASPWMTGRFAQWALSPAQRAGLSNEGLNLEILLLRINSRSPSGQKLSRELGVLKMARERGGRRVWSPFITMTNPVTGKLVSQASMRGNEQPCNRYDEFALNLEDLGYIPADPGYERRIC
ncbi:MAG: thioredoxin family protein [Pseudomonadota bacterium]